MEFLLHKSIRLSRVILPRRAKHSHSLDRAPLAGRNFPVFNRDEDDDRKSSGAAKPSCMLLSARAVSAPTITHRIAIAESFLRPKKRRNFCFNENFLRISSQGIR
jgi:hypothetical protein